jgi:hypothetical protein
MREREEEIVSSLVVSIFIHQKRTTISFLLCLCVHLPTTTNNDDKINGRSKGGFPIAGIFQP